MIRLITAFFILYGTVGGIETDHYYTWMQPLALIGIAVCLVATVFLDGTFDQWNNKEQ